MTHSQGSPKFVYSNNTKIVCPEHIEPPRLCRAATRHRRWSAESRTGLADEDTGSSQPLAGCSHLARVRYCGHQRDGRLRIYVGPKAIQHVLCSCFPAKADAKAKKQWATLVQQCAQEQARLKAAQPFGYAKMLQMVRYTGTPASGTSNERPPVPSESVMAPHHCAQAPSTNIALCGCVRTYEEGVRGT